MAALICMLFTAVGPLSMTGYLANWWSCLSPHIPESDGDSLSQFWVYAVKHVFVAYRQAQIVFHNVCGVSRFS